ncbi:DUF302 domain-containing protein [Thermococcus sp.]|uniref:DUF302 domain-containing protein n=1 Tax=Thermococcus litoralis TaxID=2265 RepID=A0A7C0Y3X5_THELI|nr:DUF302 domain-containing protein [Thermococcus sp.]OYT33537.1 MAG: hypothetical protein B6U96_15270 [Archaeoglobales archaeon ex4484_92]RLF77284.1 MAG: hypothetical protein DRN51_00100 [Thermococci archaeon]HDD31843.1 DUF302 domain-containing protein [Thermococcus litoralis]MCD6144336.1 DUF302 domain-containing protein [Thermococcus sp.]RLF78441.1 MAG: hypothetical protein DRN38_07285 [Thermococci archaeon]
MFYYVRRFEEDLDFLWERFKKKLEEEGFLLIGERIPVAIVEREDGIVADYHLLFICDRELVAELVKINPNIGALLPCTGFGYRREDGNYLGVTLPSVAWKIAGEKVAELMRPMEERVIRIIETL